jgi:ribosomal protein S18 acetylase RimI-like enzyme
MRGLLDWAVGLGARHIYLQVAEDNTAALELYRKLGFRLHHRYHYRSQPETAA